jgi:hypothetical protein
MAELSRRNPALKLVLEFNIECLDAAGVAPATLFETLAARGFTRFRVLEEGLRDLHPPADLPGFAQEARYAIRNLLCTRPGD